MAKNYVYSENKVRKFSIKGVLRENSKVIDYVNSDKEEAEISIDKILEPFAGEDITLTISTKTDEDLSEEFEEA